MGPGSQSKKALIAVILLTIAADLIVNAVWLEIPTLPAKPLAYFNVLCAALLVTSALALTFRGLFPKSERPLAGLVTPSARTILVFCIAAGLYNVVVFYALRIHRDWPQALVANAVFLYAWAVARIWAARRRKLPGRT